MLPTLMNNNSPDWKVEASSAFQGVRGLCILWVFWQHSTMYTPGNFLSAMGRGDRTVFNTATFLILTGFTTYMQHRGQKVRYGSWMLRNYFSLIPLNILATVLYIVPNYYAFANNAAASPLKPNIPLSWQAFAVVANLCGFGMFSAAPAFSRVETLGFGTKYIMAAAGGIYFGSMLFLLCGVYALFHWALTSSKTLRSLFQQNCLLPLLMAILMIVLSFFLKALDSNPIVTWFIASDQIQLLPMLMLGVCAAEMRHQQGAKVQAILGHWITIDVLFAGFVCTSFWPYSYKDAFSVVLLTMQQVLFCLLLTALSCQVFHKKRSIVVHFVLRRSLLSVFAKYSYPFYLFALPVLGVYFPAWATMLLPPAASPTTRNTSIVFTHSTGPLQWLLMLVVSMVVAMAAQWWQDKYVTDMFLSVRQYIDDGRVWKLWASEQNPLRWHNEETESESGGVHVEDKPEIAAVSIA